MPKAFKPKDLGRIRKAEFMYYIYFLTNKNNTVLYIGVTNNLMRRLCEHKKELIDGFTKKYHVHKLIYYEAYSDPTTAIKREKQPKKWIRKKKNALIDTLNPNWSDLTEKLFPEITDFLKQK